MSLKLLQKYVSEQRWKALQHCDTRILLSCRNLANFLKGAKYLVKMTKEYFNLLLSKYTAVWCNDTNLSFTLALPRS